MVEVLRVLYDNYTAQVKAEEDSFAVFLNDLERNTAALEAEKAALDKKYKRQMAQHESAQYNLSSQLTTARSPGCQFFDLNGPPPPFMPQYAAPATIAEDPCGPAAITRANDIAQQHNHPIETVREILTADFLHKQKQQAPATPLQAPQHSPTQGLQASSPAPRTPKAATAADAAAIDSIRNKHHIGASNPAASTGAAPQPIALHGAGASRG